ncbi:hypothetical protein OV450_8177 [Actinobacteria bacterium OV450]|nr:hypothetical protein OV450_8177 [Actinobacteria bacterium OV450]
MLILTREGDRRCKLLPSGRALAALVYLKTNDIFAQIAAGFAISVGTAHAYVHGAVALLAARARGLAATLRAADHSSCSTGRSPSATGSATAVLGHRRHGVNLQVITAPDATLVWISPALAGRTHDLTAARRHRIVATCTRLGIPVLADKVYQGVGDGTAMPRRRKSPAKTSASNRDPSTELTPASAGPSREPSPPSRDLAHPPEGPLSPNKLTSIAKAILSL